MKPRLESLPFTEEDLDVWWWHTLHRGRTFDVTRVFANVYVTSDLRDADLMLALTNSWNWLRSRGCSKSEWWSAVRNDVERIAGGTR